MRRAAIRTLPWPRRRRSRNTATFHQGFLPGSTVANGQEWRRSCFCGGCPSRIWTTTLTDEEADRRRLGKSQHTTSRSSERHFSSSSSSNSSSSENVAASVFRREEEILKMMKQQQQDPHVKQQPAPPLSAPAVVVVDDPSSSQLNENETWQPNLMTNQQRQTSSPSAHYKKKTKRRWRPFFPPEVLALIKDEDVVSSSLDATTLSSSSSRQLLAELSQDELKERTKDLRQWCVYANDKGRFRAGRASAPAIQLVIDTIWRVLYEWKNRSKVVGLLAAQQAHNLYAVAHTTQPAKDQITLDHLDIVLEACSNCGAGGSGGEEAAVLAEKTFVRSFNPANINSYNLLLKCWANSGVGPVAAQRADRWWQDIIEEVEQHQRCYPTNETIINYMAAWTQNGAPNAPKKVDDLFRQILHERQPLQQPQQPPPGNGTNNDGNSSTKQPQPSPSRNVVLRSKVLRHIMHDNLAPPPGDTNSARNNIATVQQPQAAPLQQRQRNIAILRNVRSQEVLPRPHRPEPQQQQQQNGHNARENKKGRPPALRIQQPQPPLPPPRPNVILRDIQMDDPALFHGVLHSWGTSGRGRPAAMEAERIVRNMPRYGCQPNGTTYSLLIAAWTAAEHLERTGDAAVRAETILQDMVQRQLHTKKNKNKLRPSAATAFTTCITAWSWAATPDAPERAEALLRQLLQTELLHHDSSSSGSSHGNNHNNSSDPALLEQPPSVVAAQNAALSVWARSTHRPDAISHMQQHFVSSMKNPDLDSYNTLLDGYARQGLTSEARALFDTMKKHTNRDLHPNLASYNVLLRAYVQSPDTRMEEVETLLYEMEDAMSTVEPDKFTYTCKC
jgi:pentatricopeptide repeat protein